MGCIKAPLYPEAFRMFLKMGVMLKFWLIFMFGSCGAVNIQLCFGGKPCMKMSSFRPNAC